MSAAGSLSYATGATPRPKGRRFVVCLRVTAAAMVAMALLVGWNIFSFFGVTYHHHRTPTSYYSLDIDWHALWKAGPAAVILLVFAAAYWYMARRISRGNEAAIFAAAVTALIHTLVGALWVLTLFAYGTINAEAARMWWDRLPAVLMMGVSIAVIPWLGYLTSLGYDMMRKPRRMASADGAGADGESSARSEDSPAEPQGGAAHPD